MVSWLWAIPLGFDVCIFHLTFAYLMYVYVERNLSILSLVQLDIFMSHPILVAAI
jgi:hypothetical protein